MTASTRYKMAVAWAMLSFAVAVALPAQTPSATRGLDALGDPMTQASSEDRAVLTQYDAMMNRIATPEAEALLRTSIEQRPQSIALRHRLLRHLLEKRAGESALVLRAHLDLLRVLGPDHRDAIGLLTKDIATRAWNEGRPLVGTTREMQAIPFFVLAWVLNDNRLDFPTSLDRLEAHLFQSQTLPEEAQAALARAVLLTCRSMRQLPDLAPYLDRLMSGVRDRFGPLLDEYIRGGSVAEWSVEGELYFDYQEFLIQRELRVVRFTNPNHLDTLRPMVASLAAMVAPELLTVEQIGKRPKRAIVGTQQAYLDRLGTKSDRELHDMLMLVSNVEGFHHVYLQIYLLDENLKFRLQDTQFQEVYRKVLADLMDGLRKLVEVSEIELPPVYAVMLLENLKVIYFMRVHTPGLIVTDDADQYLASIEVALAHELASAELFMFYFNKVKEATPAALSGLGDEIRHGVVPDVSPKWAPHFKFLLDAIAKRTPARPQWSYNNG